MKRIALALLALAIAAPALAQPAGRVTLNIDLPVTAGFAQIEAGGRQLAVAPDGTLYVLLLEYQKGADAKSPARAARLGLLALNADGSVKARGELPLRMKIGQYGFDLSEMEIFATRSGEIAVIAREGAPAVGPPNPHELTMFVLGPDLAVKRTVAVFAPGTGPGLTGPLDHYDVTLVLPTSVISLLLGGSYALQPSTWWLAKFSLAGSRLWQVGPDIATPQTLVSAAERQGGGVTAVVRQLARGDRPQRLYIAPIAADGRTSPQQPLEFPFNHETIAIRDGVVVIGSENKRDFNNEILVVSDTGQVRRRSPWPFNRTIWAGADGDGLIARVGEHDYGPHRVLRVDAQGTVRWRSATPAPITEMAVAPDGQIVALVRRIGADYGKLRLVRYAEPEPRGKK